MLDKSGTFLVIVWKIIEIYGNYGKFKILDVFLQFSGWPEVSLVDGGADLHLMLVRPIKISTWLGGGRP